MKVQDLRANARNPRKISPERLADLKMSIEKFGDLSGFVYNRRSKQLVSGHQRQKTIPANAKIKVEVKHEKPTQAMTIAEGYVEIGSERFKYREVDADQRWETEAMLAANGHGGEWDEDILKLQLADMPDMDMNLVGLPQLAPLKPLAMPSAETKKQDQAEDDKPVDEESDEDYVNNTPETTERIPTEQIPSMVNDTPAATFEDTKEETEIKNKRHLVIIECPSDELKVAWKDKLRADGELEKAGCKIF